MRRASPLVVAMRDRAPEVVWDALDEIADVVTASCVLINELKCERRQLDFAELVPLMEECHQTKMAIVENLVQFTKSS